MQCLETYHGRLLRHIHLSTQPTPEHQPWGGLPVTTVKMIGLTPSRTDVSICAPYHVKAASFTSENAYSFFGTSSAPKISAVPLRYKAGRHGQLLSQVYGT